MDYFVTPAVSGQKDHTVSNVDESSKLLRHPRKSNILLDEEVPANSSLSESVESYGAKQSQHREKTAGHVSGNLLQV